MIYFHSTAPWHEVKAAIDAGETVVRCRPGDHALVIWDRDLRRLHETKRALSLRGMVARKFDAGASFLVVWNPAAKRRLREACKKWRASA